ncbi:MAG: protocatechuate 3,4-dioxygenase [Nitrospirota bacterium]
MPSDRQNEEATMLNAARLVSRRQMLGAFVAVAGVLAYSAALGRTIRDLCLLTPPQTEGPYYPVQDQPEKDNDLTRVKGRPGRAAGQLIYILGQVRDEQCRPLEGALVEIWQAAASGRYNHPDDRDNRAPLDPNFQYWGYDTTDQEGRYSFKTVLPGQYPAGLFWTRPSHVHFKVHRRGFQELTTQMYFAGDPYLEKDRIFRAIPPDERQRVIVEPEPPGHEFEPESRICRFDLMLKK